jgi:hypothetical protein
LTEVAARWFAERRHLYAALFDVVLRPDHSASVVNVCRMAREAADCGHVALVLTQLPGGAWRAIDGTTVWFDETGCIIRQELP